MGGVAKGVSSIAGGLFGSKKGEKAGYTQSPAAEAFMPLLKNAATEYESLYKDLYWPIERDIASYYRQDLNAARPYDTRMRDYQLGRGDELINLARDTNTTLDDNKKSLIRRLTEGEDVLANRFRSEASNDIASSYGAQRQSYIDNLQRAGVNPNSGAYGTGLSSLGSNEALAQATARTSASRLAEDTSLARQADALNYYTYPQREAYDVGNAPTPGLNLNTVTQAVSGGTQYKQATPDQSGGDIFGGIGSVLGGLFK